MTPEEHRVEAEAWLRQATTDYEADYPPNDWGSDQPVWAAAAAAIAQAHATLAAAGHALEPVEAQLGPCHCGLYLPEAAGADGG